MFKNIYLFIIIFIIIFTASVFSKQNGARILFNADKTGYVDIYSIDPDNTSDIQMLTKSKDYDFWPRWSEKNKKILYCSLPFSSDGYGKSKIWTMDHDGKNNIKLTDGNFDDFFPNWSLDGKYIVFQSYRDSNGE
ncbi:PD40 domain-containing protein, partial [Candidatus Desantisbacteria bacterium]|nr:PD40 domain-containing protein [Candidatus Desantisbacteria bacterium]